MLNFKEVKERIEFAYNSEELRQEFAEEAYDWDNQYIALRLNLESGELLFDKLFKNQGCNIYRDLTLVITDCWDSYEDPHPEYYLTEEQYEDVKEIYSEYDEEKQKEMKKGFIAKYGFDYEEHCAECEREAIIEENRINYRHDFQHYTDKELQKALDLCSKYGEQFNPYGLNYLNHFDDELNQISIYEMQKTI
jgi:hypothetical protein